MKNTLKKPLSLFLTLLMILTTIPLAVVPASAAAIDDFNTLVTRASSYTAYSPSAIGGFNGDADYTNYSDHWVGLVYAETGINTYSATGNVKLGSNLTGSNSAYANMYVPTAVALYTDTGDITVPVVTSVSVSRSGTWNCKFRVFAVESTTSGVSLSMTQWGGKDEKTGSSDNCYANGNQTSNIPALNFMWTVNQTNYKVTSLISNATAGSDIDPGYGKKAEIWANKLQFAPGFSESATQVTSVSYNPAFKMYLGSSGDSVTSDKTITFGNSSDTIYVVDYQTFLDKVDDAKSYIASLNDTAWCYTDSSLSAYVTACNNLFNIDPSTYDYSSNTSSTVDTLVSDMNSAISAYDTAKAGLTKKVFTITYKYIDGTTATQNVTAGDAIGSFKANTAPKYNNDEKTHTTYKWDTTVDASATRTGNTTVVESTLLTDSITLNEVVDNAAEDCSWSVVADGYQAPTCAAEGYQTYKCATCLGTYKKSIAKVAHQYSKTVVAPTCTEQGYTIYKCDNCDDTYNADYTAAAGHSWDAGEVTTPATCVSKGEKTYKCTAEGCDETKTEEIAIDPTNHASLVTDAAVEATCMNSGLTEGSHCTACNTVVVAQETVAQKNHVYNTGYVYDNNATCISDGTKTAKCQWYDLCGKTLTVTDGAHLKETADHVAGDPVVTVTKAATCTEDGEQTVVVTCTLCGTQISNTTEKIEKLGHTEVAMDEVAATCTTAGSTGGTKCSVCGTVITAATEVPALGHDWDEGVVTAPTCVAKGYTTYTCSRCHETYTDNETGMVAHTPVVTKAAKAATCTEDGWTIEYSCSVCNEVLTASTAITASGHKKDSGTITTPATCTTAGVKTYKCTVCNEVISTEEIPATGHSWDAGVETKAATCTETGVMTYTCNNDATHTKTEEIAAKGHSWDEGTVTTAATCSATGVKTYKCTVEGCDGTKEETIAKDPTNHVNIVVDPAVASTCKNQGYTEGSHCGDCGKTIVAQTRTALAAHTWTETILKAANCQDEGSKRLSCSVCGATQIATIEIDPTNHKKVVTDEAVAATCKAAGKTEGSHCSACDTVIVAQEEIPQLAHTPETMAAVAATCAKTGLTEGSKCSVCGEILTAQEEIAKLPHTVVTDEAVAPTCTKTGLTEGSHCSVCNEVIVAQETVAKIDHVTSLVGATEATCTTDGFTGNEVCTNCGTIITKGTTIAALGHDWGTGVETKAASCSETGTMLYTCSRCFETKEEEIAKLAHTPAEAVQENVVAATCAKTGSHEDVVYCSVCSAEISRTKVTDAKTAHTPEVIPAVAATCTSKGLTEGSKCSVCGIILVAQTSTDMIDHTAVVVPAEAATCVKTGLTEGSKCSVCGKVLVAQKVIAKTAHTEAPVEGTPATCTETGLTDGVICVVCGKIITAPKTIPALGHTYVASITTEATCTTDGLKTFTCSNDATHTYTEVIPATGHSDADGNGFCDVCGENISGCAHANTYTVGEKEAECEVAGYTGDTYCSDCGSLIEKGVVIPLIGHNPEAIPAVAATCTKTGLTEGSVCTLCGKILVEQKKTPVHHETTIIPGKAATCSEAGYTDSEVCTVCGQVLSSAKTIAKTAHVDENDDGYCDVCGTSLVGDCNCICHNKSWISKIIYKILRFFWKLFGIGKSCDCGTVHY